MILSEGGGTRAPQPGPNLPSLLPPGVGLPDVLKPKVGDFGGSPDNAGIQKFENVVRFLSAASKILMVFKRRRQIFSGK
jgi:hypothetical protein